MFYELRQYTIKKGKIKQWVKLMEQEILPFQISRGMVVAGSFTVEDDPTRYIWIRRFASEAERKRLYNAVYGSSHWKKVLSPKIGTMLDRSSIVVTRIVPTSRSVLQ